MFGKSFLNGSPYGNNEATHNVYFLYYSCNTLPAYTTVHTLYLRYKLISLMHNATSTVMTCGVLCSIYFCLKKRGYLVVVCSALSFCNAIIYESENQSGVRVQDLNLFFLNKKVQDLIYIQILYIQIDFYYI